MVKRGDRIKKAIVTFIKYETFEVPISDEIYEKGNRRKAVEIAEKQMLEEFGYICKYDKTDIEFIDEKD